VIGKRKTSSQGDSLYVSNAERNDSGSGTMIPGEPDEYHSFSDKSIARMDHLRPISCHMTIAQHE
jgi:hypothetical protein